MRQQISNQTKMFSFPDFEQQSRRFPYDVLFKMAVPVTVRDKVEFHKDVYSTLIKGLLHQKESGELCDVTLRINGCKYFAHKAVLSACSPYFRSMFTSQMRETSCSEVDLTQSVQTDSSSAFQQILDFMYSGDIEITVDNAEDILRISDFLLVDDIKEYCRQFYLQHGNLNLSNCVCLSFLAENHCLPEVARVARNMLKSRFHDHLVFSDALVDVPEGCLFSLLHDRDVTKFASSDSVAQLVLRWVNFSRRERQGALLPLLSSVQLEHLSRDSIKLLLQEDEILKDSALVVRLKSLQSPTGDGACSKLPVDQGTICLGNYAELDNDILFSHQTTKPVLVAANCHPGFHYVKLLVYNTEDRLWHNLPINAEAFLSDLPARLGVVSMTMEAQTLFCLLGHNLPYPSNMLRVHVLAVDIESGNHNTCAGCHLFHTKIQNLPLVWIRLCGATTNKTPRSPAPSQNEPLPLETLTGWSVVCSFGLKLLTYTLGFFSYLSRFVLFLHCLLIHCAAMLANRSARVTDVSTSE